MSANSINTPTKLSAIAGRVARHARLVMLWILVAIACFIAYRLGQVWANWRHLAEQRPARQSMSAKESAMAAAILPLAGQWAFDDLDWFAAETGSPVFRDSLSYVDCRVVDITSGGDHDIFIGEIIGGELLKVDSPPLLYYAGKYRKLAD